MPARWRGGGARADAAAAPPAANGAEPKKSFLDSFQKQGGNGFFFVGCDCGKTGCVIFDQGKEMVCRPTKAAKK